VRTSARHAIARGEYPEDHPWQGLADCARAAARAAHGFGAEASALASAAAAGERDLVTLVPDEMARTFVVCGTPGEVAAQLEPLWDVADSLCLQPPPVPGEQRRAYDARIAETFYD